MEDLSGTAAALQPGGDDERRQGANRDLRPHVNHAGSPAATAVSVEALNAEIIRMECLILYFQNKILRKKIAIAELMDQSAEPPPTAARTEAAEALVRRPIYERRTSSGDPSVISMARSVLPDISTAAFTSGDLRTATMNRYPGHQGRIRRGIHSAIQHLTEREELARNPDGTLSKK